MRKALGFVLLVSALGLPGVGLFIAGVHKMLDLRSFLANAQPVKGQVLSLTPLRTTEEGTTYALAVAYPTGTGRTRTLTVKTENSSYREGAPVDVLYTGEDARVRGLNTTFGTPMIFTVAGLAWSAFAAFILAVALRK
jgi:hypothetical protein